MLHYFAGGGGGMSAPSPSPSPSDDSNELVAKVMRFPAGSKGKVEICSARGRQFHSASLPFQAIVHFIMVGLIFRRDMLAF